MKRLEELTEATLRHIASLSLVVLFGLILINVIARSFDLGGFAWFDEIVRGSFAYMVFFGAAALWIRREHFQVDWLEQTLPEGRARWALRSVIALLSVGFLAVMTWYGWVLFSKANALTPILQIPERGFYAAIPISGAVMLLHTIGSFIGDTKNTFLIGDPSK
ncbi:TRAP transporter small permease [Pelagimonas varians]|uniref:TRAP transporter small permease protein n=1 Tax=Pelagimonas varians TaxID=696760 RepID=A0A238L425_9RHOB|nr:TRAP transporter small permease [Pelagimonas varians]PYG26372.1 TRAP-type C4-dicarboxylate transport system permease small subunit [Pelagimonas varians]SMX49814.1 2,3-diketo-L-gulonate TRAP transporter small permease protein YiaM [Pelagimonas varians]